MEHITEYPLAEYAADPSARCRGEKTAVAKLSLIPQRGKNAVRALQAAI